MVSSYFVALRCDDQKATLALRRGSWSHQPAQTPPVGIFGCNVWKVMSQHLFLNVMPNNYTVGGKQKVWCDHGMKHDTWSKCSKFIKIWLSSCYSLTTYSLRFKIKVMFGHKQRYEIKVTFSEISLKLRQTNWNVARNNVNVVADELLSQITIWTCLIIDIWTRRCRRTSTRFYALLCHPPKMADFQ